jgi:hypothetical protein
MAATTRRYLVIANQTLAEAELGSEVNLIFHFFDADTGLAIGHPTTDTTGNGNTTKTS